MISYSQWTSDLTVSSRSVSRTESKMIYIMSVWSDLILCNLPQTALMQFFMYENLSALGAAFDSVYPRGPFK